MRKKKIYRIICTILVFLMTFGISASGMLRKIDTPLKDNLSMNPLPLNNDIKIIGIDEKTLEEYGPFGTWSRDTYACLLDALNADDEHRPAVIAFDIMFFGEVDEAGDSSFAEAASKYGNVIVSSELSFDSGHIFVDKNGNSSVDELFINRINMPYDALAGSARSGYVNISADSDGIVRRCFPFMPYGEGMTYSFDCAVYQLYCEKMGISPNNIPVNENSQMLIRYSGIPGDYEKLSMYDIINGKIDTRAFTDCIVLVGAYAQGLQDSQSVPSSKDQMYGVEIHANIIQEMIDGLFSSEIGDLTASLVFALISAVLFFIMWGMNVGLSTLALAVSEIVSVGTVIYLSKKGIIISVIYLPLMLLVNYIINVCRNYFSEKIKRSRTLDAFRKYVDPKFIDRMQKSGEEFDIELGGETRHCAFLFVDIRGFTALSECLTPKEVVMVLNKFLKLAADSVINNGGTIDKFIGDCTMGIFNAPFELDDYVFRAVCAGFDIISGSEEFSRELEDGLSEESVRKLHERFTDKGRVVGFGVGVHCGDAVVGNIGCDFRMDYTAIGDTVNTAARIEASAVAAQLLISEAVYEIVNDRVETDSCEDKYFKNKKNPVKCYSISKVIR